MITCVLGSRHKKLSLSDPCLKSLNAIGPLRGPRTRYKMPISGQYQNFGLKVNLAQHLEQGNTSSLNNHARSLSASLAPPSPVLFYLILLFKNFVLYRMFQCKIF